MTTTFGQSGALAQTVADIDLLDLAVSRIPGLRKVAQTGGGEAHGPCPACGGTNRFVVNRSGGKDGRGLFWCRDCGVSGDAVALIQLLDQSSPAEAFRSLGIGSSTRPNSRWTPPALPMLPQEPVEPPCFEWREQAQLLLEQAEASLWSEAGDRARAYLHSRGLTEDTIRSARLGYLPTDAFADRAIWGLPKVDERGQLVSRISLSKGILIPYLVEGEIWRLEVRRPITQACVRVRDRKALAAIKPDATGKVWRALCDVPYAAPAQLARATGRALDVVQEVLDWLHSQQLLDTPAKYVTIAGSANAVWGLDTSDPARPGILVEGVLNGLSIMQEAGDLVNVAALGATTHGRKPRWMAALMRWPGQLIALDADAEASKGDQASVYWIDALQPTALRWRPSANDANAMLLAGHDIRSWVAAGIVALTERAAPAAAEPATTPPRVCVRCGSVLAGQGIVESCAACAQVAPAWRSWEGEPSAEAALTALAHTTAQRTADQALREIEAAPNDKDSWWNRFEELLNTATDGILEVWNDYQYAYAKQDRTRTRELVMDLRDVGGGRLLDAWLHYKTAASEQKGSLA